MLRSFIEIPFFYKKWTELGLSDSELKSLQGLLLDNPAAGNIMQGTGGVRKLRMAIRNRGKSAGIRICYVDFEEYGLIYLLTVYQKKDQENLSNKEKNEIKELVKLLKDEAAKRRKGEECHNYSRN